MKTYPILLTLLLTCAAYADPIIRTSSDGAVRGVSGIVRGRSVGGENIFDCTGTDQYWTNTFSVTQIFVKAWGAGACAGYFANGYGGGGGYVAGYVAVTNNEILTIIVGTGGVFNSLSVSNWNYGGGAGCIDETIYVYVGGGRSAVRRANGTEIITAGGGGGGGGGDGGLYGGAGGGTNGLDAANPGGTGGTQSSGGAGGTGDINGFPGTQYKGGLCQQFGGGGGGGWFGGGGGARVPGADNGGGGGSGYTVGVFAGMTNISGSGRFAGNTDDVHYVEGIGLGGLVTNQHGGSGSSGGNAKMVIIY